MATAARALGHVWLVARRHRGAVCASGFVDYTEAMSEAGETLRTSDNESDDSMSTNLRRHSRTSSISSTYSERYTVNDDEVIQLVSGLNFWEIHDLELVSGLPQDQLMERFPEMEQVHGRSGPEEEPPSPVPSFCPDCLRPLYREVVEAIDRGLVRSCSECSRPLLAADRSSDTRPFDRDIDGCRCRCVCSELDDANEETCYLPFLCNNRHLAPAPWVLALLEERGFCLVDRCNDGGFCSMVEESNLPTLGQIRNHTYRDDCRQQMDEAGLEYQHYLDSSTFPNGVLRDRSSDSGLPQVLENYFRSLDPGAFGHEPSTRPNAPSPDSGHRWEEAEMPHGLPNFEAPLRQHDMERNLRLIGLHRWINQNEWRLEEDDAISFCTADDLGIDRGQYDTDLYVAEDSDQVPNAASGHEYRHLFRRYERIVQLGGHVALPEDLDHVVQSEMEYHDFLEFIDTDRNPPMIIERQPVIADPSLQPEELREAAGSASEAALCGTRAHMLDFLHDQQPLRTIDSGMFDILERMQMQRPRMIIVGGPIQRDNLAPDTYGELTGPLRRVMVGRGMTVLIEEDELDMTDVIFVNCVEDLSGPGPAVDAGDVDSMDVDPMD